MLIRENGCRFSKQGDFLNVWLRLEGLDLADQVEILMDWNYCELFLKFRRKHSNLLDEAHKRSSAQGLQRLVHD